MPETVEATARRRYEEEESRARQERIEAFEAEENGSAWPGRMPGAGARRRSRPPAAAGGSPSCARGQSP